MADETPSAPLPPSSTPTSTPGEPRRRTRGKALAILVALFVLGLASGAVLDRVWMARQGSSGPPLPFFAMRRAGRMRHLMHHLDLTTEQEARFSAILSRNVERFQAMQRSVRPRFFAAMEETRREIEAVLTSEQREHFHEHTAEFRARRRRWMRRGMGFGPRRGMGRGMGFGPGRGMHPGPAGDSGP